MNSTALSSISPPAGDTIGEPATAGFWMTVPHDSFGLPAPDAFPDRRRARWLPKSWRWWTILLLCCAAFAIVSRAVEFRRRRHEARDAEYYRMHREISYRVGNHLGDSKELIEAQLNQGAPLREFPSTTEYRYCFNAAHLNPAYSGWRVICRFKHGLLYGAYLVSPPRTPYVRPSNNWVEIERLRRYTLGIAGGAWVLGFFMLPFSSRWRRDVAQFCLAAVLVAALAWALNPDHVWTTHDWRSPPVIALAIPLLISLAALLKPLHLPPLNHALCAHCGYDLTGNQSGICPECGVMTLRARAERWREDAERMEQVDAVEPREDDEAIVVVATSTNPQGIS